MNNDFTQRVIDWNLAAGNTADKFNVRQTALYTGLQLEEMAEKLEAIATLNDSVFASVALRWFSRQMKDFSHDFKAGHFDQHIASADRTALLDADADIMVVTVGSMMSQGADVHGALAEVCDSNDSKGVECPSCLGDELTHIVVGCDMCNQRGWILQKNEHGKIVKGSHYRAPELSKFINKEQ